MVRREIDLTDPCLREMLGGLNAEELKRMLALIPSVRLKAPRKGEVVDALVGCLLGAELPALWNRLNPLEQPAVAEAAHQENGTYDPGAFHAKYGGSPVFDTFRGEVPMTACRP